MKAVEVTRGDSPLVLGLPHTGTFVPDEVLETFTTVGQALADTDWHIHDLYDGLVDDVTSVRALFHRYVIDANRDPSGESLYPGQNTTTLCPLTDFDGRPLYQDGFEPDEIEIESRLLVYHQPYHRALAAEIRRVREKHGFAILYDCHSIRSVIPFLFENTLLDMNVGTNLGTTCAAEIENNIFNICKQSGRSHVLNGRFKGGWTTRHYGEPDKGCHAIQMELAQSTYMQETPPWTWQQDQAAQIRPVLKSILETLKLWSPS